MNFFSSLACRGRRKLFYMFRDEEGLARSRISTGYGETRARRTEKACGKS